MRPLATGLFALIVLLTSFFAATAVFDELAARAGFYDTEVYID